MRSLLSTLTPSKLGIGAVATAALAVAPATVSAASYTADLDTLNGPSATGTANLEYNEETRALEVSIEASGLEPNAPHPQHIHGLFESEARIETVDSVTPTLEQDTDDDGFIELGEGLPVYGPILLPLTVDDGTEEGAFAVADEDGNLSYNRTFILDDDELLDDLTPLDFREIVIHGLQLEEGEGANGGEADGTAGYKAVLPVAAGEIVEVDANVIPTPTAAIAGLGMLGGLALRRRRAQR